MKRPVVQELIAAGMFLDERQAVLEPVCQTLDWAWNTPDDDFDEGSDSPTRPGTDMTTASRGKSTCTTAQISGRSIPMPKAFVAQTTHTDPAANASYTRERSVSASPAWYAAAGIPAPRSVAVAELAQPRHESGRPKPPGGDIQKAERTLHGGPRCPAPIVGSQLRVQRGGRNAAAIQVVDLILHQCDQISGETRVANGVPQPVLNWRVPRPRRSSTPRLAALANSTRRVGTSGRSAFSPTEQTTSSSTW